MKTKTHHKGFPDHVTCAFRLSSSSLVEIPMCVCKCKGRRSRGGGECGRRTRTLMPALYASWISSWVQFSISPTPYERAPGTTSCAPRARLSSHGGFVCARACVPDGP